MTERWETVEAIAAAKRRFEAEIPGWRDPVAYGVGVLDEHGSIEFVRVNADEHQLPAVVLATICGHRGGSASYRLSRSDLARAVELLNPAEACTAYEHPNLWAWRELLPRLEDDQTVVAVYVDDWADPGDDPHIAALRIALGR